MRLQVYICWMVISEGERAKKEEPVGGGKEGPIRRRKRRFGQSNERRCNRSKERRFGQSNERRCNPSAERQSGRSVTRR